MAYEMGDWSFRLSVDSINDCRVLEFGSYHHGILLPSDGD